MEIINQIGHIQHWGFSPRRQLSISLQIKIGKADSSAHEWGFRYPTYFENLHRYRYRRILEDQKN